jgi:hypothetical protein
VTPHVNARQEPIWDHVKCERGTGREWVMRRTSDRIREAGHATYKRRKGVMEYGNDP